MKTSISILSLVVLFTVTSFGLTVTEQLQDQSVTIVAEGGQGSGVVKIRDGVSYVWTAGHVVSDGRKTRTVVDSVTKAPKTIVYFDDVRVVKDIVEDGRLVATVLVYAEVIKFSGPDNGEDLALLRLRKKVFVASSVNFYLGNEIQAIGTEILHVGSLLGHFGSNSLTSGIISQEGRIFDGKVYDQTSATALPGSSGGGVFLKSSGQYVGMLVRGVRGTDTVNFIIPVRRMQKWAKKEGVYWAMDDSVPVDLKGLSLENYEEAPSVDAAVTVETDSAKNNVVIHDLLNRDNVSNGY